MSSQGNSWRSQSKPACGGHKNGLLALGRFDLLLQKDVYAEGGKIGVRGRLLRGQLADAGAAVPPARSDSPLICGRNAVSPVCDHIQSRLGLSANNTKASPPHSSRPAQSVNVSCTARFTELVLPVRGLRSRFLAIPFDAVGAAAGPRVDSLSFSGRVSFAVLPTLVLPKCVPNLVAARAS